MGVPELLVGLRVIFDGFPGDIGWVSGRYFMGMLEIFYMFL